MIYLLELVKLIAEILSPIFAKYLKENGRKILPGDGSSFVTDHMRGKGGGQY